MDPNLYKAAVSGNLSYFENLEDSPDFEKELTPYKDTALHVATEFNQTKFAIKTLQVCRPLLLLANSTGNTALHIAAGEGNKELVEVFIDYMTRSDIETGKCEDLTRMVNWKEDTALHVAARRGRCECVKLLAEADPEVCSFVNKNGESPLYLLVASGYGIQSEIIINNDLVSSSSAFYCGPMGLTALHASVLLQVCDYPVKNGVEEIELLVRWRREMIRKGDDLGMTPLHFAALYGRIEVVKLFVEYDNSAIYVMNNGGQSALHLAAYSGHIKILQQLVNCRPDCYKMVDKMGRTALHAAVLGKQKETIKFILETPSFEWLFNMADNDGNTPLHLAADFKFIQIIQTFSSNTKVRFDILNNKFWTPVRVYTRYNPESIQELYLYVNLAEKGNEVMRLRESAIQRLEKMRISEDTTTNNGTKEMTSPNNKNLESEMKWEVDVVLVVATLVATVTFTAGLALPGGLGDRGEDRGLANLTDKPAFKAFVIFNSLAFFYSISVVCFHFINSTVDKDFIRLAYKEIVKPLTTFAVYLVISAFCSGSYVMLTKSTGLAMAPSIVAAVFIFILWGHMDIRFVSHLLTRVMVQQKIQKSIKRIATVFQNK